MSFIDDILGLGGSDNNEEENTEESGGLNPLGLAAIAGGFLQVEILPLPPEPTQKWGIKDKYPTTIWLENKY